MVSHLTLQVFQANNDATEVVLNKLHTPLLTRFVRIRPQTWHSGIALRLELFGCRVTGEGGCDLSRRLTCTWSSV